MAECENANPTLSNSKEHYRPHEEYQYLDLITDILDRGEFRPDRYF